MLDFMQEPWVLWVQSHETNKRKYGLARIRALMEALGNPQDGLSQIHVTGTNGKGSTIAFISQLARSEGYQVGAFVSPHLIDYRDRILVNGQAISRGDFVDLAQRVAQAEETIQAQYGSCTFFEIILAMAWLYFAQLNLDLVLIEVGIGGLLDTTNILHPQVTVISSVGLDHQALLGNSLEEIAIQKTGIVKSGVPLVLGPVDPIVGQVAQLVTQAYQAPLLSFGQDFGLVGETYEDQAFTLSLEGLGLKGRHQLENACLAIKAYQVWLHSIGVKAMDPDSMSQALRETRWPGRLEPIHLDPKVILDGAHNPHAMKCLIQAIQEEPGQATILFSALKRKDFGSMLESLQAALPHVPLYLTSFDEAKGLGFEEFQSLSQTVKLDYVPDYQAFTQAFLNHGDKDRVLWVTGSLYFISDFRTWFLETFPS